MTETQHETQQATPGRWEAEKAEYGPNRYYLITQEDRGTAVHGVLGTEDPGVLRLILAAVNAVREATPDLSDTQRCDVLEGGLLASLVAGQPQHKRDRALLAECREALRQIVAIERRDGAYDRADMAGSIVIARALLSRLDAQEAK